VNRHQFLRRLHENYKPRTYFEIGINDGRSLALSRVPTVAVDPAHRITSEIHCDLHLVKATSDDFFAREKPLGHLGDKPLADLAFIDGMHLFEYVLRDFINTEKYADWSSVIVFDDQLPANADQAARDRHTGFWTGDVYKIIPVLQRYRPDLRFAVMDTEPTGVMVVFGADPTSTVLSDKYDEIMDQFLLKDPQDVPGELSTRAAAMQPEVVLEASFWSTLVAARDSGDKDYGRDQLLADVDKALADAPKPNLAEWLPDSSAGRDEEVDQSASVGEIAMMQQVKAKQAAAKKAKAEAAKKAAAKAKPATPAEAAKLASPPNDMFRKLAKKVPFLRRLPGAQSLVRKLR
jgi:hypothetical protein